MMQGHHGRGRPRSQGYDFDRNEEIYFVNGSEANFPAEDQKYCNTPILLLVINNKIRVSKFHLTKLRHHIFALSSIRIIMHIINIKSRIYRFIQNSSYTHMTIHSTADVFTKYT